MRNRVSLLLFAGFILMAGFAGSEESGRDLEIFAALNKNSIVVGEPLFLNLLLENRSDHPIEFRSRLSPYGDVQMRFSIPERLPVDYKGTFQSSFYPHCLFKMPPRGKDRVSFAIYYFEETPGKLLFDKPMKARLEAEIKGYLGEKIEEFRFPPMILEVKEPEEKDREALDFLRNENMVYDIHQGHATRELLPKFEKFLELYPDTTYTPFVLFTLADGYRLTGPDGEPDYHKAITLFKQYIREYPDTILTDDAVYRIGDCHDSLGDEESATRWFVKLYNNYLTSNRVSNHDPMMQKYIYNKKKVQVPRAFWMLYNIENHAVR